MNNTFDDFSEQVREARRAVEREREYLMEKADWLNGFARLVDAMDDVVSENERLREENEELRCRVQELCKQVSPSASVAFYNYGVYNEVKTGGMSLTSRSDGHY